VSVVTGWQPLRSSGYYPRCRNTYAGAAPPPPAKMADELADMAKVADYEHGQMAQALGDCQAWPAKDPRGFLAYSGRVHAHLETLPPLMAEAHGIIDRYAGRGAIPNDEAGASYAKLVAWRAALTVL
jgi:hypothetical protein